MKNSFDKLEKNSGYPCSDNSSLQPLSCCVCRAIVDRIQKELNNTLDDHPVDTVFRLSEEKISVPFSHTEGRIMEVVDYICPSVTFTLPDETQTEAMEKAVKSACHVFVQEYEDELIHVFYNNAAPGEERMCRDTVNVCRETTTSTRSEL